MSFSSKIKEELAGQAKAGRHCRLAELSAIISFAGNIRLADGGVRLRVGTEHALLKQKYRLLLSLLFDLKEPDGGLTGNEALKVLESVKMWDKTNARFGNTETVDGLLIQQACCKRAFIRGAFLASGSLSDPSKAYHFEIVCHTAAQARQLQGVINSFDLDAKIVVRKKNRVVYVKEGENIVDLLNIMEAHAALMDLENVRIVKEVRNAVNRQVNCETANIGKTVSAAVRQIEDIRRIREKRGLESLPDNLKEIAVLRLQYPDAPLKELGSYLNPPVGKSGVNHRLRRISEIAAELQP